MSPTSHTTADAGQSGPRTEGERQLARALAMLESDHSGSVTLAVLRERGVSAPAQAVYDLQLAGHVIDRVSCTDRGEHRTLAYRLRDSRAPAGDPSAGSREVARDGA
jgi:hypothetical protein